MRTIKLPLLLFALTISLTACFGGANNANDSSVNVDENNIEFGNSLGVGENSTNNEGMVFDEDEAENVNNANNEMEFDEDETETDFVATSHIPPTGQWDWVMQEPEYTGCVVDMSSAENQDEPPGVVNLETENDGASLIISSSDFVLFLDRNAYNETSSGYITEIKIPVPGSNDTVDYAYSLEFNALDDSMIYGTVITYIPPIKTCQAVREFSLTYLGP